MRERTSDERVKERMREPQAMNSEAKNRVDRAKLEPFSFGQLSWPLLGLTLSGFFSPLFLFPSFIHHRPRVARRFFIHWVKERVLARAV